MSLRALITTLSAGIWSGGYERMARREAMDDLKMKSEAMVLAARRLREADLIIRGLVSDAPTFAHREAALQWIAEKLPEPIEA